MTGTRSNKSGLPCKAGKSRKRIERIVGLIAVVVIILVWLISSFFGDREILPYLKKAMPKADRFEIGTDGLYTAYNAKGMIGYINISKADGYGGPMTIATAVDMKGDIIGITVIDHKETPSFLKQVVTNHLFESLLGRSVTHTITLGKDVNGISGATYSSRAVISAVSKGAHSIGREKLNLNVPLDSPPDIKFAIPEITVLLLFIAGFLGREKKFKYTKQIRWISLLTGLGILGFIYNTPLTLSKLTGLLLGFIPCWQLYIYWILLIGGILLYITLDKKNPYCQWFCPFGAAQECLGVIGGAKVRTPVRFQSFLRWTQRGLAFSAVILAILFRNPGLAGYEIFGALFSLTGSTFQMILLMVILIASLFIKRPWCSYLCPMPPVMNLFIMFRKWIEELWKNRHHPTPV
ncbi:MAG: FMN-binding protein [Desulfobacterales bacterium]|nr:FMN-binding protein [Desulfobacterales bacterium]